MTRPVAPWPRALRRSVSFHEAGHCAAALSLGLRVRSLSLNEDGRLGDNALGFCDFVSDIDATVVDVRVLLAILCGPAAQVRACGVEREHQRENAGHVRDVRAVLDQLRAEGQDVESLEQMALRAGRLIGQHWPTVTALAERLTERGEVGERDILTIAERTTR